MGTYFHRIEPDADPADLLKPENQVSTPWGDSDEGPCEKCSREGVVDYRCLSCIERGEPAPDCESCAGRVEWRDTCPSCEGDGLIDRTTRRGVSVFPTERGLYRYLVERDTELDGGEVIELRAELSGDRDLDADEGALLVLPESIVDRRPIDSAAVREVRAKVAARRE